MDESPVATEPAPTPVRPTLTAIANPGQDRHSSQRIAPVQCAPGVGLENALDVTFNTGPPGQLCPAINCSAVDSSRRPNGSGSGFEVSYFSGCRAATIWIILETKNAGSRIFS